MQRPPETSSLSPDRCGVDGMASHGGLDLSSLRAGMRVNAKLQLVGGHPSLPARRDAAFAPNPAPAADAFASPREMRGWWAMQRRRPRRDSLRARGHGATTCPARLQTALAPRGQGCALSSAAILSAFCRGCSHAAMWDYARGPLLQIPPGSSHKGCRALWWSPPRRTCLRSSRAGVRGFFGLRGAFVPLAPGAGERRTVPQQKRQNSFAPRGQGCGARTCSGC
jgi:hypothetical protein